jgi:serine/threonine-protein kinase
MTTDKQLDKYRILEELGKGGFATVYRAVDTTLDREVALKVLDPLLMRDEKWTRSFRQEAKTVAKIKHANIVTIYEISEVEGRLFIAMDLIDGRSLDESIDRQGRLSWDETIRMVKQIAEALQHAHTIGVVHRDLKPRNILLSLEGNVVLTDFGFARWVSESSISTSLSGGIVGSPHYIAPEIWDGKTATPQTDIYALGCIVYEMLTGKVLFAGDTPSVIMRKHLLDGPRFPETWPTDIPQDIEYVLSKALAQNQNDRFGSVDEFSKALIALNNPSTQLRKTSNDMKFTRAHPEKLTVAQIWIWGSSAIIILLISLLVWQLVEPAPSTPTSTQQITPSTSVTDTAISSPAPTWTPSAIATLKPTSTATTTTLEPSSTPTSLTSEVTSESTPTIDLIPTPTSALQPATATSVPLEPSAPNLMVPENGAEYQSPIIFKWEGQLYTGQAYVIRAWNTRTGYTIESPKLNKQEWASEVPGDAYGEWKWTVAVYENSTLLTTSTEEQFWFNPFPGGDDPQPTNPPPSER